MALKLRTTTAFEKDLKRLRKRKYDLEKLGTAIDLLQAEEVLAARYRDHPLKGVLAGCRDCHIEPDWLLLYRISDPDLILIRTGTHADLFDL